MANYRIVHNRISKGRGKAARVVGQPMRVTRLTQAGFRLLFPDLRCLVRKITSHSYMEQQFFVPQIYELVCDVRKLEVGDLLEEDPAAFLSQQSVLRTVTDADMEISSVGSVTQRYAPVYLYAHVRPIRKFIGVRLDTFCQIRRGVYDINNGDGNWQQQGENSESVLVLPKASNQFRWDLVNTSAYPPTESQPEVQSTPPVLIPFQLTPAYARAQPPFQLPMDWGVNKWHFCCPSGWSNLLLRENDQLIDPKGNRFRIHVIWENYIGPEVTQGLVEKLES